MTARRRRAGSAPIRLMIVDDHGVVRAGLVHLLGRSGRFRLVGTTARVAGAVAEARRLRPDVVLMDLRLQDGSGIEASRAILDSSPGTRVLLLTSHSNDEAVMSRSLAPASGYLLKDIGRQTLVQAIETVARGGAFPDPRVTQQRTPTPPSSHRLRDLSSQEKRVLERVAQGLTNKEIGAALNLSDKTVRNYLSNAFQKLQVRRRAHAVAILRRSAADE